MNKTNARPEGVADDELRVLPVDHLKRSQGLVLEAGAAPVTQVYDPDPNAPPKRRRGRPPGQKMRLIADSLRHHHFSFLRANIEGVRDLRWAWEHYLGFEGGPDDERHFQQRLRDLTSIVTFAAGERGMAKRSEIAFSGLDLRPPSAPPKPTQPAGLAGGAAPATPSHPPPAPALPTLEEWIKDKCAEWGVDYDFQRQSEWLEQYEEEFGLNLPPAPQSATSLAGLPDLPHEEAPSPSLARSGVSSAAASASATSSPAPAPLAPLEERVEQLNILAFELSKPPTLLDPLGTWLMPELSKRLGAAAIRGNPMPLLTLVNLIDFVNLFGHRWWVHVPRLGEERAARLMLWLVPQAEELGRPIKESARVPHAKRMQAQQESQQTAIARLGPDANKRFGLVPLDRLSVPAQMDGRVGVFRSTEANTLGVDTDLEAIYAWLRRRQDKPRTVEQYGRMLERFYLWCLWVKKKPFGDLVEGDFHDYKEFLRKPPADWVSERSVNRASHDWRPMRGPQNENSLRQNFTVINAFLTSLHQARYLTAQAAAGVMPGLKLKQLRVNIDRSFDDAQWAWVMDCLNNRYEAALEAEANAQAEEDALALKEGRSPQKIFHLRAALLRRQRLVLDLGATTGLRLIELVTTRRGAITREIVDGESVWLAKIVGKGGKVREVMIYEDIKTLMDQHHADMDSVGTSFDPASRRVREVNNPDATPSAATPAAAPSTTNPDYTPDPGSGLTQVPSPSLSIDLSSDEKLDERMRPLVGALRKGFSSGTTSSMGSADREGLNSDRYGSLDPNGLRQALKRFLASCADEAQRVGADIDIEKLRSASTHWMRHFFANSLASDGATGSELMEALGHTSLATTSVYLRQERKRLVNMMGKMRRR